MSVKENIVTQILEIAADCCSYTNKDGSKSIKASDIVSKERIGDNVNLTRCIVVRQMKCMGFTTETLSHILNRTESTIRDMVIKGGEAEETSQAYRISAEEVKTKCASLWAQKEC